MGQTQSSLCSKKELGPSCDSSTVSFVLGQVQNTGLCCTQVLRTPENLEVVPSFLGCIWSIPAISICSAVMVQCQTRIQQARCCPSVSHSLYKPQPSPSRSSFTTYAETEGLRRRANRNISKRFS